MAKETIEVGLKNKSGILKCSNPQTFRLVREKFSVPNSNYKLRHLRKYMITPIGAFEVGLWNDINSYILSLNKPFDIRLSDEFKAVFQPKLKNIPILSLDVFEYYDYQRETLRKFFDNGRGISLIATGGGKTAILGGFCKSILAVQKNAKILIIVPTTGLLNQTYGDFVEKFGIKTIERWGDGYVPTFEESILIAGHNIMWQDIIYTISKVKDYDYVLVDEVHLLGEKKKYAKNKKGERVLQHQISKIVHNIHTPHKFGLTGTLPDKKEACWNIIGKIGSIVYVRDSYQLRQQGTISKVFINIIYFEHSEDPPPPMKEIINSDGSTTEILDTHPTAKYNTEKKFLYRHAKRNDIIKKIASKSEGNGIILIDSIEQGEILQILLESANLKVYFVRGSMESADREKIIKLMEKQSGIVCIAMSKCFATGISINNLHWVIFPSIGKSSVKIAQSIGRSVRLHESKDLAKIYDLADDTKYSSDHLKQRLKLYKKQKLDYKTKRIGL